MRVEAAEVRGVSSGGMICCAADLGWADESDGVPVHVPADEAPGTLFPEEPYPVSSPPSSPPDTSLMQRTSVMMTHAEG